MAESKHAELKEKAKEELRLLLIITVYLGVLFWAFIMYKHLIKRELGITGFHYGFAAIEAIVIAKVILIGKAMGLGKRETRRTLAWAVIRISLVYGILIGLFAVLEHVVEGLIHGKGLAGAFAEIGDQGIYEILARTIVLFVALIPFFAIWKLDEELGERKLSQIFFGKRSARAGG